MSELAEIKKACDGLGAAFEAFKAANAVELKALRDGSGTGEIKTTLAKIETDLLKFDETKARFEKAILAASNRDVTGNEAKTAKAVEYKSLLGAALKSGASEDHKKVEACRIEIKGMSSLSGPEGGFWLTLPEVDPTVRADFVETSDMRSVARVDRISGPSMKGRRRTSRASTGGWVGEQDTRSETATPQVGEWEIFAREAYAEPHAPQSFIDDAAVDIEAWLRGEVDFEISILENTAFLRGVGGKSPRGLLTYPVVDPGNGAFIEKLDMGTSNVLASDDLIGLLEKLKEVYQPNARFAFKRATLSAIRKLTTGSVISNYVWQPGLTQGAPSTLLGKPYSFFADMDGISAVAGTYPMMYGDFRETYRIVDRQGISVIRDAITTKGFVKFYSVKRVGGDVVNFESMKFLANIA